MTEPDVALTDYLLVVECALFVWLVRRGSSPSTPGRRAIVLFFGATAAAALAGGTMHGFFNADSDPLGLALWRVSLLSIGVAAFAGWRIGAELLIRAQLAQRLSWLAAAGIAAYSWAVLNGHDAFWVAMTVYLPASFFLLVALTVAAGRPGLAAVRLGAWGLVVTFLAAGVQQLQLGFHPQYFSHNAVYHVMQAIALVLMFLAFRTLLQRAPRFADSRS